MERQANTFTAGYDNVKEAFDRLRASVGEAGLLPGLESIDASFAKLINRAEPLADLVGRGVGMAMKAAAAGIKLLAEHAGILIPLLTGLVVAVSMRAWANSPAGWPPRRRRSSPSARPSSPIPSA